MITVGGDVAIYPVLAFGKSGPGVVYVMHPPPPIVRFVIPQRFSVLLVDDFVDGPHFSERLECRTFRLRKYAALLSEIDEWAAWGEVREIPASWCAGCGLRGGQHSAGYGLDCRRFRPGVEQALFVPVYVEEDAG